MISFADITLPFPETMDFPQDHEFELVRSDHWLKSSAAEVADRHQRYQSRLAAIEALHGSLYAFAGGHHYFGFSLDRQKGLLTYREWAPAAHALHLAGDFNGWNRESHPLSKDEAGVWSVEISMKPSDIEQLHGSRVKVWVSHAHGSQARIPAYIRRVVQDPDTHDFSGQLWFPAGPAPQAPPFRPDLSEGLYIYECHPGMAQEKEGVGTWEEFRKFNLPRIREAGYNAIQMMAVMEHPYYGSFGYHVSNFFAPSSRFGTPEELRRLIADAHEMGIAVIMDVVHSHTVKNTNEGINEFDGSDSLYFHPGPRGLHPDWDSRLFDYGKDEVQRFLLSNLRYWLEEFRFDGFRFDGVGSMMYFHHGHEVFDSPEKYFSQGVEWDAITYLQLANHLIHHINPHSVTIAEDVTGMPGLCRPIAEGGIGFDFRLGMGLPDFWVETLSRRKDEDWNLHHLWHVMNDRRPDVRTIAYCESHDQAMVGDKTMAFWLMDKEMYHHMRIDDPHLSIERGIALHKMIRLVTLSLGGQAWLNFMGNEFGHPEWIDFPREGNGWSYHYARRQWSLADDPELRYHHLKDFDQAMISLAREYHLQQQGYGEQLWLDDWNKTLVYRKSGLIFVSNFHVSQSIANYEFPVPEAGVYQMVLDSDDPSFGGQGRLDPLITYPTRFDGTEGRHKLRVYSPCRTITVYRPLV